MATKQTLLSCRLVLCSPPERRARIVLDKPRQVEKAHMAKGKGEVTGKKAGSAASKVMRDPGSSKVAKSAAASALTQRPGKKK
jgi:hypothetical protein